MIYGMTYINCIHNLLCNKHAVHFLLNRIENNIIKRTIFQFAPSISSNSERASIQTYPYLIINEKEVFSFPLNIFNKLMSIPNK